jgi:chromate transporter
MNRHLLWLLATSFAPLSRSLVMFGGANAIIPEIHQQVVELHSWMDNAEFATLFTVAQAAPGLNILIVSLISWQGSQGRWWQRPRSTCRIVY